MKSNIEISSELMKYFFKRGNECVDSGEFDTAISFFDKALNCIANLPTIPEKFDDEYKEIILRIILNKVNALNKAGRYFEVIGICSQLTENDGFNSGGEAWYHLGYAHMKLKQYQTALKYCRKAATFDNTAEIANMTINVLLEYDKDWVLKHADDLDEEGNYKEACTYYDKALDLDLNDATTWNNKAATLNNMQLYFLAKQHAQKAISIYRKSPNPWRHLGVAYCGLKEYADAERCLRTAVELLPTYEQAWVNLGEVYGFQNRFNEAIEAFHKALTINPSLNSAKLGLEKVVSQRNDIDFSQMLLDAASLGIEASVSLALQYGDNDLAMKAKVSLDSKSAAHLAAKYGHEECLRVLLNHDIRLLETVDDFQQTPLHFAAYHGKVKCVELLLKYNANVHASDSVGTTAIHNTAVSHSSPSNVSETDAKECIRLLILYGGDITAITNKKLTAYQMANEGGMKYSTVSSYIYSEMSQVAHRFFGEGVNLSNAGNHQLAINKYKQGLKITPDDPVGWNNLGYSWNQLGEHNTAIDCCQRAIKYDSRYANPWRHLGNARFALGEYEAAMRSYNKALQLNPNYEEASSDKERCQRILDELAAIKSIHHCIQSRIVNYKTELENKISNATIAGITFFYNKELSTKKQKQADDLLIELNALTKSADAHPLLQRYLQKDEQLAANYEKDPGTFSQLLSELINQVDGLAMPCSP